MNRLRPAKKVLRPSYSAAWVNNGGWSHSHMTDPWELIYLPAYMKTIKTSTIHVGKYTIPLDLIGYELKDQQKQLADKPKIKV